MAQEQSNRTTSEHEDRVPAERENRIDDVGETNIYPVSEMEGADDDAVVHAPGLLGDDEQSGGGVDNL